MIKLTSSLNVGGRTFPTKFYVRDVLYISKSSADANTEGEASVRSLQPVQKRQTCPVQMVCYAETNVASFPFFNGPEASENLP